VHDTAFKSPGSIEEAQTKVAKEIKVRNVTIFVSQSHGLLRDASDATFASGVCSKNFLPVKGNRDTFYTQRSIKVPSRQKPCQK